MKRITSLLLSMAMLLGTLPLYTPFAEETSPLLEAEDAQTETVSEPETTETVPAEAVEETPSIEVPSVSDEDASSPNMEAPALEEYARQVVGSELEEFLEETGFEEDTEVWELDETDMDISLFADLPAEAAYSGSDSNALNVYNAEYFRTQLTEQEDGMYADILKNVGSGSEAELALLTPYTSTIDNLPYRIVTDYVYTVADGDDLTAVKSALGSAAFRAMRSWKYDHLDTSLWTTTVMRATFKTAADGSSITMHCLWGYSGWFSDNLRLERDNKLAELIDDIPAADNRCDTLQALYGLVRNLTVYDHSSAASNADQTLESYYYAHSSVGSLLSGKGVCESYAKCFKLLCDSLALPCICVVSTSHMWNYVQMENGLWYMIDCTWGDLYEPDSFFLVSNHNSSGTHRETFFHYPETAETAYVITADSNGDRSISIEDADLLAKWLAEGSLPGGDYEFAVDLNRSGNGDLADLRLLLQRIDRTA